MKPTTQELIRALLAICRAAKLRNLTRAANAPRLARGERTLRSYTRGQR